MEQKRPPPVGTIRRAPEPLPVPWEITYLLELPSSLGGGHPWVDVQERVVVAGGKPTPWQRAQVSEARVAACVDPDDKQILTALRELSISTASVAQLPTSDKAAPGRFQLSRAARERLLPLLGRTGRLRLRHGSEALTWSDDVRALRLAVEVVDNGAGNETWAVRGLLRAGDETLALTAIEALFEGGLFLHRGTLGRIDDGGASSWLGLLRQHQRVAIPLARRAAFLEELYALPSPPPLDLPVAIALDEHIAVAQPRLYVHAPSLDEGPRSASLFAALSFDYEGVVVAATRPGKVAFDAARMRLLRRDASAEAAARACLESLELQPIPRTTPAPPPEGAHLLLPAARLPRIVDTLLGEGFKVEAAGKIYRRSTSSDVAIKASGVDWFELSGSVSFDGIRVPLPAILASLRRGDDAVLLDDGTLGVLPDAWLRKHGLVARLGVAHEGRVRFLHSQVGLLDELVASEPTTRVDEAFTRARAALGQGGAIAPAEPPEGFHGELRAYQREGLGWMRLPRAIGLRRLPRRRHGPR